ncbi:MAG: hypothetical protein JWM27_2790 [Gemmatimonadetes bacterium]|nr:hypothetical protein [Gemmatimonadota bacterium]
MSRLLLILVALIVLVLVSRPLRERVEPHVQFALDPIYGWSAKNRVTELKKLLEDQKSMGRTLPPPRDFLQFIQQQDPTGGGVDPWGNPYYLLATRTTFQVGSPGKDGVANTTDDVLSEEGAK